MYLSKKQIKLLIFTFLTLTSFFTSYFYKQTPQENVQSAISQKVSTAEAKVTKVIDGDTIQLEDGRKIRYIGIDAPETNDPRRKVECFGQEAKKKNKEMVVGKSVRLEKDVSETDKYGRLLRYAYIDNIFINDYLVRQGFASVATFPPDVKFAEQFRAAEQEARENNRGLWNNCTTR